MATASAEAWGVLDDRSHASAAGWTSVVRRPRGFAPDDVADDVLRHRSATRILAAAGAGSPRDGGTRVAAAGRAPAKDRHRLLGGMAAEFVSRARALGFTDEEIIVALGSRLPLQRQAR